MGATNERHEQTIARFVTIVDEDPAHLLRMTEVYRLLGVSSRTLTNITHGHLKSSPFQYIIQRRMAFVRQTLQSGHCEYVKDAAAQFGFFELGQFSARYRKLYGETPSTTLRRHRAEAEPSP
jgi:AraC family transcriptional regulator, ethanolamine operon transcriptional activator